MPASCPANPTSIRGRDCRCWHRWPRQAPRDCLYAIHHCLDEKNAGIGGKQAGRAKVEPRALHVQYPVAIGLEQPRHDAEKSGKLSGFGLRWCSAQIVPAAPL